MNNQVHNSDMPGHYVHDCDMVATTFYEIINCLRPTIRHSLSSEVTDLITVAVCIVHHTYMPTSTSKQRCNFLYEIIIKIVSVN